MSHVVRKVDADNNKVTDDMLLQDFADNAIKPDYMLEGLDKVKGSLEACLQQFC